MKKKMFSIIVASSLVLSSTGMSFASDFNYIQSSNGIGYTIQISDEVSINNMTKSDIIKELKNIGFNDYEIKDLFIREELSQSPKKNSRICYAFPSNPSIGDRHTETYNITNSDLGFPLSVSGGVTGILHCSKSKIAKKIVQKYGLKALGWATLTAGYIISYINDKQGFSGFNVSVEYYYGEDNNMSVSWTPGIVDVERYE